MKIKLAVLDKDPNYLNRMVSVFGTKYADNFEIYSFTDLDVAMATLASARIEVFVASDAFEIDVRKLPPKERCGFGYLVESADVEELNGQSTICKFQRADFIYKQILNLYPGASSGGEGDSKLIFFQPVSGGVGASAMAAACAMQFAAKGKKTLYLNLERFGSADAFFTAQGPFGMSDVIFALKSKKANLALKLESCVKQADNGVCFYSQAKIALDMLELTPDDIMNLILGLQTMSITEPFDYIIVDMDFSMDRQTLNLLKKAHAVVWVGDGSEISNNKLYRAYTALSTIEQNGDFSISNRLVLAYNKFSNKTGKIMSEIGVKNIGGAPRIEHATTSQVLQQLAARVQFDAIM